MKNNPVGWFEIYVKDLSKSQKFYEAVLDTKLTSLPGPDDAVVSMVTFPMDQKASGTAGAIVTMHGGQQPSGSGTIVYFVCDDCAVEAKRAPENGGKIFKDKFSIGPYGFIALITDSDGNVVGLHSMK
jgi:uncharacterized protein